MGCLYPGRIMLGVGTGEALNEYATGFTGEIARSSRSASRGCASRSR